MEEEWRDVVGWEGIYQVSNLARVRRVLVSSGTRGGPLKPHFQNGYPAVHLCGNGNGYGTYYVHRLVAAAFLGEPPDGKDEVDHISGNRADSSLANLRWVSPSENIRYAWRREQANIEPIGPGNGIRIFDKYNHK